MATPKRTAFVKAINERGGEDTLIYDKIADGWSFRKIAQWFQDNPDFQDVLQGSCSGALVHRIVRSSELRKKKYAAAKLEAARSHAEEAGTILEEAQFTTDGSYRDISSGQASLVKERSGYRKWLATINDPETYADKSETTQVNVNILHLEALKAHGSMPGREIPSPKPKQLPEPEED